MTVCVDQGSYLAWKIPGSRVELEFRDCRIFGLKFPGLERRLESGRSPVKLGVVEFVCANRGV